ncbi:MAG: hypothetical protein EBT08_09240, partial [Betaproteobacteria bacterium]|nr:hypothetical protein [Betaproteobacteria bacterium]
MERRLTAQHPLITVDWTPLTLRTLQSSRLITGPDANPTEPKPLRTEGLTRRGPACSRGWRALALAGCGWALMAAGLAGCATQGSSPGSPRQHVPASSVLAGTQTTAPAANPTPRAASSSAAASTESSARTDNATPSLPSPTTGSPTETRVPLEMAGPALRSPGVEGGTAANGPAATLSARPVPAQPVDSGAEYRRIAGNYQCGQGYTVRVNSAADARDPNRVDAILLTWQGAQHRLQEVKSVSGAARFENQTAGLLWIMI